MSDELAIYDELLREGGEKTGHRKDERRMERHMNESTNGTIWFHYSKIRTDGRHMRTDEGHTHGCRDRRTDGGTYEKNEFTDGRMKAADVEYRLTTDG